MVLAGESARPVLECQSVERRFGGIVALNGIDMRIERGEIFGLVGPNGCGKTTLTNAVTGFYPPQRGHILLNGREITGLAPRYIATLGVARTFQNLALFNGMSVLDNILLGRHIHMKPGVARTALYWWLARSDETLNRAAVEDVIDFLQLEGVRDMKDYGVNGLMAPVTLTAQDHGGGGKTRIEMWDGSKWVPQTEWIAAFKDDVWSVVEAQSADYLKSETQK